MDKARWDRVQAIFHEALERPETERHALVAERADGDAELIDDVTRMLEQDAQDGRLLDRGVDGAASDLLEAGRTDQGPPRQVGRYRLLELLGEGGMGVVYLAERPDLGNRVAIKILRDAWLSPARRERFTAEQRMLAQLNHPGIAALYDADALSDGTPWFAMEYVDGVPVTEYCKRHATSIPGRLQLIRGVAEAVLYAHRHAVIHRDLKPSNVLVKADGSIRLLDFGIAKQLESIEDPQNATRTALRMLTPAYASPEQIRGEPVDIQSDVYSLGVMLYELLSGSLPFDLENRTPAEAAGLLANDAAPAPSTAARRLAAALPAGRRSVGSWSDVDVLCLTALHPDRSRRYGSVEGLIRDIDHLLAGEPLDAHSDTLGYRVGKFVSRNRRAVAAAALVVLAAIALTVFYSVRVTLARNRAVAETAKTERIQAFMIGLFTGGDDFVGPSDDLRVVTLVDRGVREAQALDDESEIQAELFHTLGGIYQQLGRFEPAGEQFKQALGLRRSIFPAGHPAIVETLVALASLRLTEARLEEAEPIVQEALALANALRPVNPILLADAIMVEGRLHEERGDYDDAIASYGRGVELLSTPGVDERELVRGIGNLANANYYAGYYDESEALNRRALEIDRRLLGERHPNVADDLINIGAIEFQRGLYEKAEELDRTALEILTEWYGRDHPETASAMTLLGRALVYQDKVEDAEPLLTEALEIQERAYGDHPRVASVLNDLSHVMVSQGKYDEGEKLSRRQIEIYHSVYGERHPLVATALSNLASIDLRRERYAAAEKVLRDVVERYTEAYSPEDLNTAIARIKLGRALIKQERWAEAERESRTGHDLLAVRTDPSVSWLDAARKDLVIAYEKLGRPEEAAKFRPEPD